MATPHDQLVTRDLLKQLIEQEANYPSLTLEMRQQLRKMYLFCHSKCRASFFEELRVDGMKIKLEQGEQK